MHLSKRLSAKDHAKLHSNYTPYDSFQNKQDRSISNNYHQYNPKHFSIVPLKVVYTWHCHM